MCGEIRLLCRAQHRDHLLFGKSTLSHALYRRTGAIFPGIDGAKKKGQVTTAMGTNINAPCPRSSRRHGGSGQSTMPLGKKGRRDDNRPQ
jgi:hypothetical protein